MFAKRFGLVIRNKMMIQRKEDVALCKGSKNQTGCESAGLEFDTGPKTNNVKTERL